MNEKRARYNFYLYKWQPEIADHVRRGDRITVSIRDLGSEKARQEIRALREAGVEVYGALPVLWRPGQGPLPEEVAGEIDGWYAGNLGQVRRLLDTGRPVMGDAGLNVFNLETAEVFADLGLSGVTWSYELEVIPRRQKQACDLPEGQSRALFCHPEGSEGSSSLSHLPSPFTFEVLRRGRIPAMVSEYCPLAGAEGIKGSRCGRCREENPVWLKDFKGERYPVLLEPEGCTSLILSRQVLDRPEAEAWAQEVGEQGILRICVFD